MTQSNPPGSPATPSKLFIRSEVLAVIDYLLTVEEPPKQDKIKQIRRLSNLEDRETVQKVLVKELQRATSIRLIQVISELLMELGDIELVKQPLWGLIQNPQTSDEVKDAANLILRQLGDPSDPNLYLEYLDDPAGLINRETERMLEVSTRNPEALIDFIDFIFSLPVDEQGNLLRSLQADYPSEYLLNIYIPTLDAIPPYETQELILTSMGDIRSKRAALFLYDNLDRYEPDARLGKAAKKSINKLRIAGLYKEEQMEAVRQELDQPHPIVQQTELYQCFATIPDGIGNQGIVISRQRENGDVTMMSVAVNDIHGIIDCFGFYDLSKNDFHKITEKFHEESSKIHAPAEYCLHKLRQAERRNRAQGFRLPYEYSCWKVILSDIDAPAMDTVALCKDWANPKWDQASINLYQHPDFNTWFLEEGDHPVVTDILQDVLQVCARAMADGGLDNGQDTDRQAQVTHALMQTLDKLAEAMVHGLLSTEWRQILTERLADAAYLLHHQKANTFASLAATEVQKLLDYQGLETPLNGFVKYYGRRCIEEDLLRLRQNTQGGPMAQNSPVFDQLVDAVLGAWQV